MSESDPGPSETTDDIAIPRPDEDVWASRRVKLDVASRTDQGKVRDSNEDHHLVVKIARGVEIQLTNLPEDLVPRRVEDVAYAMVVADGMGGMAAGEQASRLALQAGLRVVLESSQWSMRPGPAQAKDLMARLEGYFQRVDRVIVEDAEAHSERRGMATTLTVAYLLAGHLFIVHAGDSRIYRFREGSLTQLTKDHTYAQDLADRGHISPESVKTHYRRHILTNFAGGNHEGIDPQVLYLEAAPGDRLLLCSDGLTEMVPDERIAELLHQAPRPAEAVDALVEEALKNGGHDNVTVIVAEYLGVEGAP